MQIIMLPWSQVILKPRTWSTSFYRQPECTRQQVEKTGVRFMAVISKTDCGYYKWRVTHVRSMLGDVKSGVCRSLDRAKKNCDYYMKKKLKFKLLHMRHANFL